MGRGGFRFGWWRWFEFVMVCFDGREGLGFRVLFKVIYVLRL